MRGEQKQDDHDHEKHHEDATVEARRRRFKERVALRSLTLITM
jgi:hypothetical protein